MEKNFKKYSIEYFTQDIDFINWIKRGDNNEKWEEFVRENAQLSKEIDVARNIVNVLRLQEIEIDDKSINDVFENIEHFYSQYSKSRLKVRTLKFMRYAAIFVLFASVSIAIPYYYLHDNDQFSEFNVPATGVNEARLTLSSGEEITLTQTHSELQFNASGGQIKINKDSIINTDTKEDENSMAQIVIPFGMRSDILLSDGTKVWLNAGSRLVFPQKFSGKIRKVFLKGEAFFDVAKNKDVPFIVSTENMNVTVLGTAFNVNSNESENELEVVLVEGSVSMKENKAMNFLGNELLLKPNQKATYNKSSRNTQVESRVDVSYYISWKDGMLEFNRESIINVFKKLSQFYNVRFENDASVEMNQKISGKLDLKESLDAVMKVVSDATPINYRIEGDKVIVTSKINSLPM